MTNKTNANQLAVKMVIALVAGIVLGIGFILLREYLVHTSHANVWTSINNLLFQDIHTSNHALGLFYIIGQLFINSLQLIIVPMVFTSITLAMYKIADTRKLGRISLKTILGFGTTYFFALVLASIFGVAAYHLGLFNPNIKNITSATGTVGSNPLLVIVNAIPNNLFTAFMNNGSIIAVVLVAIVIGLSINALGDQINILKKILEEFNHIIILILNIIITKFGPFAIFILLTRTFAIYGIDNLYQALSYVIVVVIALLIYLVFGYALFVLLAGKVNPLPFVRKVGKVALFGFSTSSSASTLPLNTKTTVEELGVDEEVASFVLPLGMTVNMNGTAIMQVIATIFIASFAGYHITIGNVIVIAVLALIASIGTPAAPGAGAIILFTLLSGMGYNNDAALMAYALILAINRPIEMLVTSLNVVGDSATSVVVAKSEGLLNETIYNE